MLFWTGQQREASSILQQQVGKIGGSMTQYKKLFDLADECRQSLLGGLDEEKLRIPPG